MLPQLAIWHISGREKEVSSFWRKLQSLCLATGGQKQTNNYDYLFAKCHHCCSEKDSNPFCGSIAQVANVLAHVYKEYKYNSVNAYQSAISSVHKKVDVATQLANTL